MMLCPIEDDARVPFSVAQMHATVVEKAKLGLSISESALGKRCTLA